MRQLLKQTLAAADASVDQAGAYIPTEQVFQVSVQVVTTGTSTGTLKLQFSNDITNESVPQTAPTNWIDITGATVSVAGAGSVGIVKTDICYQFIRAVYSKTNGASGTISVNIKGFGV